MRDESEINIIYIMAGEKHEGVTKAWLMRINNGSLIKRGFSIFYHVFGKENMADCLVCIRGVVFVVVKNVGDSESLLFSFR